MKIRPKLSLNKDQLVYNFQSVNTHGTLVAVIGGFRSAISITRKNDGKFGNVSADVLFFKVAYR